MKVFKYLILSLFVFMLGACTAEEFEQSTPVSQQDAPIELAISLDNIAHVNMNSRATEDDKLFSQLNHINIRISFDGADDVRLAYQWNGTTWEQKLSTQGNNYVVDRFTTKDKLYVHLNPKQGNEVDTVEVVANYKKGDNYVVLDSSDAWTEMKQDTLAFPTSFNDTDECVLYGLCNTPKFKENAHEGAQGGNKGCWVFNVPLKRPYAMVKVGVNLQGLKEGVTITPKFVQLCNVPKVCNIDSLNKPTAFENKIDKDGQKYTFRLGETQSGRLYLFENMQGIFLSSSEQTKNPNRATDPQAIYDSFVNYTDPKNKGRLCSYVLLEAEYEYRSEKVSVKGPIRYRFYLGGNLIDDFNVERNVIYNLTLNLKGFGGIVEAGAVKDGNIDVVGSQSFAQWRVDTELSDFFVHFGAGQDFNIDGSSMFIDIEVGGNKKWEIQVENSKGEFVTDSWALVTVRDQWGNAFHITPKYGGDQYSSVTGSGARPGMELFLAQLKDQSWFNLKNNWNSPTPYDSAFFCVREMGKPETEKRYVIRRWYPINVPALGENVYVDRVDRVGPSEHGSAAGVPWGDEDFTSTATNGWDILRDYWRKATKMVYKPSYKEGSVMERTLYVTVNSNGNSTEQPELSGWMQYNYFYLPTVQDWKEINKVLTQGVDAASGNPIHHNYWRPVPYWTSSTSGNQSYSYTPGRSNNASYQGDLVPRSNAYRYRLIYDADKFGTWQN